MASGNKFFGMVRAIINEYPELTGKDKQVRQVLEKLTPEQMNLADMYVRQVILFGRKLPQEA